MWRFVTYSLGLIALTLLAFFCVKRHVPSIEIDLLQSSSAVLRENKLTDWASVKVKGRAVFLSGEAPDNQTHQRAMTLIQGVEGVRQVTSEFTQPSVKKVEPPVTEAQPPYFPDPYQFKAGYDGHHLALSGHAPNIKSRSDIVNSAEQLFGAGNVTEEIIVTQGGPDYWQIKTIQTLLASLTHPQQAKAELNNKQLKLSGIITSPELKEQIESQLKQALPPSFVSEFNIVVAKPVVDEVVETTIAAAAGCQQQFNQLLSETKIHFKHALSEIDPVSMELLDKLADSAGQCKQATIEIAGYTDSSGDGERNMELSYRRAQAVKEALVSRGITTERLLVKGYGQNNPIADNSTPEGRALNRRIELNISEN